MKKIVLLNVLLAMLMAVNAQTDSIGYKSIFGREFTEWRGATMFYDLWWENHVLQTDGDTVIGEYTYKKVTYKNWCEYYLKEDPQTGKVWCRYPDRVTTMTGFHMEADTDYLIMDLSLEINDSIVLTMMCMGGGLHDRLFYVSSIDYVDSMKHIVLMDDYDEYGYYGCVVEFVEGAGCSNLFGMIPIAQIENEFVCCHKDGVLVYHNPTHPLHQEGDSCQIPPYGNIIVDGCLTITVSPNPCTDWVVIEGENIQSASLCDINGIILLTNINVPGEINMADFPIGVYFIRVVYNNTILCKKIIKR